MKAPSHTCKIIITMKPAILFFAFSVLILLSGCSKGEKTVSIADDSLFISKKDEAYSCVRLRRGDVIELNGIISCQNGENGEFITLTTAEGRTFILNETEDQVSVSSFSRKKVHLKGSILFEGNGSRLPVLSVIGISAYKPQS